MDAYREQNRKFTATGIRMMPVVCSWPRILCSVVALFISANILAARMPGLYGAVVDMPAGASQPQTQSFNEALSVVLVKVTGLPDAGSMRAALFPNAAAIVQQYSVQDDDTVRVDFDPDAVRAAVDRAGMPVWGDDRPLVAVWLAVDAGGGQRYIVSGGSSASADRAEEDIDLLRDSLTTMAEDVGLPVVIPLIDANDMARVSFSDLWGDFRDPVVEASARYGADAVLIGRSRSLDPEGQGVRWTLVAGNEQAMWQGNVWSGPAEAAIFLARRQATFADSAGRIRLLVTGIDSLDKYGQLTQYLNSLGLVDTVGVARLIADSVEFDLVVRGDAARLAQTLDSGRRLVRSTQQPGATATGRLPDLVYGWPEGP